MKGQRQTSSLDTLISPFSRIIEYLNLKETNTKRKW